MHHFDVGIGSMTAGICEEHPHHDVLSVEEEEEEEKEENFPSPPGGC